MQELNGLRRVRLLPVIFFRLEKKRGASDWISAMRNLDGSLVTEINAISDSWVGFYSSLFTATPVDMERQASLLDNLSSFLSPEQSALCDGPLTTDEVFLALKGMARGKSPGSDGFPAEFYMTFWEILGSDLVDVLNASYCSGSLPFSQRNGLISLIFKKGDHLLHKNWRPISLLNLDYKLCSRALAGRLLKVLQHVIHPDQTCGVRGRFIGENVAFLRDVIEYSNEKDILVAILSLDQDKAFDRVNWDFLQSALARMRFGTSFISWVRLLYTDIRSSILINGYTSDAFFPSRGVRQGCPLSPLLYVISIEVLAAAIHVNPAIVGLRLPRCPRPLPVLSLYADDTSVISLSDASTVAVFDTYSNFELGTGAKLNLGKCEGLWLGPWKQRLDRPVPIAWTSDKIKVLGVFLGNGDLEECNWRPRIDAVERCLNSWRSRQLSYGGKALIITAIALSRVWYVASLIPMPLWALGELNTLVFHFFWSGRRDLVARNVVIHSRDSGGFSVVAVKLKDFSLLVQWVRRFVSSPAAWVSLLTYWFFDRFSVDPLSVFSNPTVHLPGVLPPFYASLLRAWVALGGSSSSSVLCVSVSGTPPLLAESLPLNCVMIFCLLGIPVNPIVFPSFLLTSLILIGLPPGRLCFYVFGSPGVGFVLACSSRGLVHC